MSKIDDEETVYLREFVLGYCDGNLVTSEKTDRESLRKAFPLLRYAIDEPHIPEDVGLVWTYQTEMQGARYPYFSLNYLTRAQTERVRTAIAAEKARRKTIKV